MLLPFVIRVHIPGTENPLPRTMLTLLGRPAMQSCIAMGVAFYLVSMQVYHVHTMSPFEYATDVGHFNTTFSQLGLFVLALGLLLTGAGPQSAP